jgi:regulator of sigma E protease
MISTIIILAVVLSLLVFVHELGHFATAKIAKIRVEEFGFGFPPRLFGFKRGNTVYSINWIPLGGFVRIKGESGEHSKDRDSFANKSVWVRGAVICAGVCMNIILAWFVLTIGYMIGLPQVIDELPASARVADQRVQIYSVLKGSPADVAGLLSGDVVSALDGERLVDTDQFRNYTGGRAGVPVRLSITRDSQALDKTVTPTVLAESNRPAIGVSIVGIGLVSYPWYMAPAQGLAATGYFLREILVAFYSLLRDLFTAQKVTVELSGPVGIAVLTAEVVKMGFRHLLQFTALLSVNLAVINILPFPALDGGRLFFLVIESIRRRAVSAKIEASVHNLGFAFLMLLVLVITYQDVVKFGDRILATISGIFRIN